MLRITSGFVLAKKFLINSDACILVMVCEDCTLLQVRTLSSLLTIKKPMFVLLTCVKPWSQLGDSCRSLSLLLQDEAAVSIFSPGWDASPLQVTPPQFVWFFAGTHLFSWVERDSVEELRVLPKNGLGSNPERLFWGRVHYNPEATTPPLLTCLLPVLVRIKFQRKW